MDRLVLTDASLLIGLARVDGLAWLGALFGVVWIPPEVRREVLPNRSLPDWLGAGGVCPAAWLRFPHPVLNGSHHESDRRVL